MKWAKVQPNRKRFEWSSYEIQKVLFILENLNKIKISIIGSRDILWFTVVMRHL